jgi:hypothetical protein
MTRVRRADDQKKDARVWGRAQAILTHFNAERMGRNRRPRVAGIDRLREAKETNSGPVAIRLFEPHSPLLDGRLINDGRSLIAGAQDLVKEANLPRLATGALPGELAVELPRRLAQSIWQEGFLPEHPGRRDGNPHHFAIHKSLGERIRGYRSHKFWAVPNPPGLTWPPQYQSGERR